MRAAVATPRLRAAVGLAILALRVDNRGMIAYLLFCILCAILALFIGLWAGAIWIVGTCVAIIGTFVDWIIKRAR